MNALRIPLRNAAPLRRAARTQLPKASPFRASYNNGRKYSTAPPPPEAKSSGSTLWLGLGAAGAAGVAWYFFTESGENAVKSGVQQAKVAANFVPTKEDYEKVCRRETRASRSKAQPCLLGLQKDRRPRC